MKKANLAKVEDAKPRVLRLSKTAGLPNCANTYYKSIGFVWVTIQGFFISNDYAL